MDGVHDMGGLHGFGPIPREADEPVFHADWEARVFALVSAVPFTVPFSDDQLRPAIEAIPPADYLRWGYYQRWLQALEDLLVERQAFSKPVATPAVAAADVMPAILAGASQARPLADAPPPRFQPGQSVRTAAHFGPGHNRLPRYARDKIGRIESLHGAFLVADAHSAGRKEPEMLYTVMFAGADLWNEPGVPDTLSLDLWDRYLAPVGA